MASAWPPLVCALQKEDRQAASPAVAHGLLALNGLEGLSALLQMKTSKIRMGPQGCELVGGGFGIEIQVAGSRLWVLCPIGDD